MIEATVGSEIPQTFYYCPHDGTIVRSAGEHLCQHALIGTCYSLRCAGSRVDLDGYGNCSTCGSVLIFDRSTKYPWSEVLNSLKTNGLLVEEGFRWSSLPPIAKIRKFAAWLYTAVHERQPISNT